MSNLPGGTHVLSGVESQRLRTFCSSETFSASDLDEFAILLQNADIAAVRSDFEGRVEKSDIEKARQDLAAIQHGPTKVSLFNYLLQLAFLHPPARSQYLQIARYLAIEAKVPVDTPNLSGTTTFMYSISTKPYWDKEFAEIMLEGGAEVNRRNRYGCTAANDITMA